MTDRLDIGFLEALVTDRRHLALDYPSFGGCSFGWRTGALKVMPGG